MNWFNVSDIASLVGRNKWKPADEMIEKYRKRYFPDIDIHDEESDEDEEDEVKLQKICESINIKPKNYTDKLKPVTNSNKIIEQMANDIIVNTQKIETQIKKKPDKKEIKKIVKSVIYKAHGNKTENYVEDWINTNLGEIYNQQKGKGINLIEYKNTKWRLYGKIDGMINNDTIIEIKNRQNRLFHWIPTYEYIQIQIYMHIFGFKKAILVEHYQNQYKAHHVKFDPVYVKDICDSLISIVKDYYN